MKKKPNMTEEPIVHEEHEEVVVDAEELTVEETAEEGKGNIVSRTVYTTVYAVSFGVVFSSLLVAKLLVPKNSIIEKGLHDGTVAARKALEEKERLVVEVAEQTAEILSGEEPAAVSL